LISLFGFLEPLRQVVKDASYRNAAEKRLLELEIIDRELRIAEEHQLSCLREVRMNAARRVSPRMRERPALPPAPYDGDQEYR
jgi:hypothetical protein